MVQLKFHRTVSVGENSRETYTYDWNKHLFASIHRRSLQETASILAHTVLTYKYCFCPLYKRMLYTSPNCSLFFFHDIWPMLVLTVVSCTENIFAFHIFTKNAFCFKIKYHETYFCARAGQIQNKYYIIQYLGRQTKYLKSVSKYQNILYFASFSDIKGRNRLFCCISFNVSNKPVFYCFFLW